jgi:hypothetical protein
MGFVWFSVYRGITSLNKINQMIFIMAKCCVLFEVRTELKYCLDELRLQRAKSHEYPDKRI